AERAAVDQAGWARVTRQLCQSGVVALRFQFGADGGVFLHRLLLALVALFPCFLRHKILYCFASVAALGVSFASASGKPIIFNRSNASASVFALVTMVTSMPCVRLILSSSISGKIVWSEMPN